MTECGLCNNSPILLLVTKRVKANELSMKDTISFYGFTDSMEPRMKGMTEKRLKTLSYKGKVYNRVKFQGESMTFPEYYRMLSQQCVAFDSVESNGKTTYRAITPEGSYYPLNKTQFDFCRYLKAHGFDDNDKAAAYRQMETQKAEQAEKEADAAKAVAEEMEKKKAEQWRAYNEKLLGLMGKVAADYPDAMKIAAKYADKYRFPPDTRDELTIRLFRVPAILLNYESLMADALTNQFCDSNLSSYLETRNQCSRRLFQYFTGIKLPPTNRDTKAVLEKWKENPIIKIQRERNEPSR